MSTEETNLNEDQGQETEQQKNDKITKKHAEALRFVTALVGGEENLRPKKTLTGDVAAVAVAKLLKTKQEKFEEESMQKLENLLEKYLECENEIAKNVRSWIL